MFFTRFLVTLGRPPLRARFTRIEPKSCRNVLKCTPSSFVRFSCVFVFQIVFESCKHLGKLPKTLLGNKKCSRHERRATEREFQNWLELEADVSFRHCGCKINVLHRHTVLTVVSYLSTHWAGSGSVFVALSVVFASVKANSFYFAFCCGETV